MMVTLQENVTPKNSQVSQDIPREVRLAKIANGSTEPPVGAPGDLLRGVSINHLATGFMEDVEKAGFDKDSRIYEIEPDVIRGKAPSAACPRDGRPGLAYVDALQTKEEAFRSTHMLSYTWGYTVASIVNALSTFAELHGLDPKRVYVWICCLCVNQHRVREAVADGSLVSFEEFAEVFSSRVKRIGKVLALLEPWHKPYYITRVWCDYELFTALENAPAVELEFIMPPAEAAAFATSIFEEQDQEGARQMWNTLGGILVQNAQASVEQDRLNILQAIEEGPGFDCVNSAVRKKMQMWFAEAAETLLQQSLSAERIRACGHVANMFVWCGWPPRAQKVLESGLKCLTEAGKYESVDAAYLIRMYGVIVRMTGDIEGALAQYTEAIRLHRLTNTLETEDCANCFMNKGNMEVLLDKHEAGTDSYSASKRIRKKLNILDVDKGALLLTNFGSLQGKLGQTDLALQTLAEAFCIREKTDTIETPDGAFLMDQFGTVQDQVGAYDEALESFRKARKTRDSLCIQSSADGALSARSLGLLHVHRGEFDEAVKSYREAAEIRKVKGTLDTREGKQLTHELGEALILLGRQLIQEGEQLVQQDA